MPRLSETRLRIALVAIAVVIAASVAVVSVRATGCGSTPSTASTDPAAFVLPRLGGGDDVRLSDLKGRPTVFYDASGTLRFVTPGAITEDTLRADLRRFYGIDA